MHCCATLALAMVASRSWQNLFDWTAIGVPARRTSVAANGGTDPAAARAHRAMSAESGPAAWKVPGPNSDEDRSQRFQCAAQAFATRKWCMATHAEQLAESAQQGVGGIVQHELVEPVTVENGDDFARRKRRIVVILWGVRALRGQTGNPCCISPSGDDNAGMLSMQGSNDPAAPDPLFDLAPVSFGLKISAVFLNCCTVASSGVTDIGRFLAETPAAIDEYFRVFACSK